MPIDTVVILDTEYTTWEGALDRDWSGPDEHREIVQIAAIRVDGTFNEIDHFDIMVRPSINHQVSDFFVELTGITQDSVDGGLPLSLALAALIGFVGDDPIVCMNGDQTVLEENCRLNGIECPVWQWHRLRPFLEAQGVDLARLSSGDLHTLTDKPLVGHTHNALHDVRSMASWLAHAKTVGVLESHRALPTERMAFDPRSRLHRVLIRIERIDADSASVVIPSWSPDSHVTIPSVPGGKAGGHLLGYVNLDAETASDLVIENISVVEESPSEFE